MLQSQAVPRKTIWYLIFCLVLKQNKPSSYLIIFSNSATISFLTLTRRKRGVFGPCLSHHIKVIWRRVVIIFINLHRCWTNDAWKWLAWRRRWPVTDRFHADRIPKLAGGWRRRNVVIFSLKRNLRRHQPLSFNDQTAFKAGAVFPLTVALVSFQNLIYAVIPASRTARRPNDVLIGHAFSIQFGFLFRHTQRSRQLGLKLLVLQFALFQLITVKQLIYHLRYFYCKWVLLFRLQLIRFVIG